jgi:hypothetical protein
MELIHLAQERDQWRAFVKAMTFSSTCCAIILSFQALDKASLNGPRMNESDDLSFSVACELTSSVQKRVTSLL